MVSILSFNQFELFLEMICERDCLAVDDQLSEPGTFFQISINSYSIDDSY